MRAQRVTATRGEHSRYSDGGARDEIPPLNGQGCPLDATGRAVVPVMFAPTARASPFMVASAYARVFQISSTYR